MIVAEQKQIDLFEIPANWDQMTEAERLEWAKAATEAVAEQKDELKR